MSEIRIRTTHGAFDRYTISRRALAAAPLPAVLLPALSRRKQTALARGRGDIAALASADGGEPVERWRYVDPEAGFYEPRGLPSDTVYVAGVVPLSAASLDSSPYTTFAALAVATGEPRWRLTPADLPGDVGDFFHLEDEFILVSLRGDERPTLLAIDAATGVTV